MLAVISSDIEEDADRLEARWGIPVALEMLHEHVITVLDFFELCGEAANATGRSGPASTAASPLRP